MSPRPADSIEPGSLEALRAENQALRVENQILKDEIARLKGLPSRPPSKPHRPSGMEKAADPSGSKNRTGRRKTRGAKRDSDGAVAKFWRLPRVEHAGGICTSEPEVADGPERPRREAEAPVEGRFQGPALRSDPDPASRLVVPALSAQLSRHRGAVSGARLGGRPLYPEPVG